MAERSIPARSRAATSPAVRCSNGCATRFDNDDAGRIAKGGRAMTGISYGVLNPIEGVAYCDPKEAAGYVRAGAWKEHTVGDALRACAKGFPDRHVFISDERSITYAELDAQTDRLGAALLDCGLVPGDRAIFQMGTTVETAIALLACYKAG